MNDPQFDVPATQALVLQHFGETAEVEAHASFHSVFRRLDHARYHYSEINRLMTEHEGVVSPEALAAALKTDGTTRRDLAHNVIVEAEAHIVGAVAALHSVADTWAFALYYATGQHRSNPIDRSQVTLHKVAALLSADNAFSPLGAALVQFQAVPHWDVLHGLSNRAKHRAISRSFLVEDMVGRRPKRFEMRIEAGTFDFVVKKQSRQTVWRDMPVLPFLEELFNHLNEGSVALGRDLHGLLLAYRAGSVPAGTSGP